MRAVLGVAGSLVALGLVGAVVASLGSTEARELELPPALVEYAAAPVAPAQPSPDAAPAGGGSRVDARWVGRTARAAGIPVPAVRAYAAAQLAAPCEIGWTTLAGIGWIESQHGTLGGRQLLDDGHSTTPILGPALDGVGPVAAIPASADSALLHTDPDWDHAVGPMQFITSTWMRWRADGDGDGLFDPYDIDDAALASARYLCASGDLSDGPAWARAIWSYNHSQDYVDAVHDAATAYSSRTR